MASNWKIRSFFGHCYLKMVNWLNSLLRKWGYMVTPIPPNFDLELGYSLFKYTSGAKKFDYERYTSVQIKGNKSKLEKVWATPENIEHLAEYIKRVIGKPNFGICHGTRRGLEQKWFSEFLNCRVLGTEISDTATLFENTIQWDFHNVKSEWIDSVDFIYSNSFDHSYDPPECLNAWMSCVRKGGLCIIEHSKHHGLHKSTELDPFGVDVAQFPYFVAIWGKGLYGLREIINAPSNEKSRRQTVFFVIQKW